MWKYEHVRWTPFRFSPLGDTSGAEGGVAVHQEEHQVALPLLAAQRGVSSQATDGARLAVGTHHGPTRTHYAIGGTATLALRYSIISATAASRTRSVMTAGRRELLEHGHRRRIRRSLRTFRGTTGRTEQRED